MITITRDLARQFRAAMRKARLGKYASQPDATIHFAADASGLRIRVASPSIGIEYRQADIYSAQVIWLPADVLEDIEGRGSEPVTLESDDKFHVRVSWSDRGVPQLVSRTVEAPKKPTWPELPKDFTPNPTQLWTALRECVATASRERLRFALDCIQLRGASGQIAGADDRHVLQQGGYELPWPDEVLLSASGVLGWKELAPADAVNVGRAGDWVTFAVGNWTISLRIEKDARYPRLDDCFPAAAAATATLEISPSDAEFLVHTLPSLPISDEDRPAATLDLNGQVLVRGRGEGQDRPTELVLNGSRFDGQPQVTHTDRRYLSKALGLGFRTFRLFGPGRPILAEEGQRRFLWAVLDQDGAIKPAADPIRIESSAVSVTAASIPPRPKRQTMTKTETPAAGAALEGPVTTSSVKRPKRPHLAATGTPIEQVVALRDALRAAAGQANELIRSLKRQKRQARLVQSTLDSLKALQKAAG